MSHEVVVEFETTEIVFETSPIELVVETVGARGARGTDGAVLGSSFSAEAGSTIFGGRVVRISNGVIDHPLLANPDHAEQIVGISTQAGSIGAAVIVQSFGQMADSGWSWNPGFIYCDDAGVLTQIAPATGWIIPVAKVINATTIFVDIDTPFFRS